MPPGEVRRYSNCVRAGRVVFETEVAGFVSFFVGRRFGQVERRSETEISGDPKQKAGRMGATPPTSEGGRAA